MPTRREYRQQIAKDLGGLGPTPTGGVATGGTTSTLEQASWPVQSRIPKTDQYEGWSLLRPNAIDAEPLDLVRAIDQGKYDPANGVFEVDLDYTNPPAADEVYELHGHEVEPWYEMNDLIDQALKLIYIPVQTAFIPVLRSSGSYLQNLTGDDRVSGLPAQNRGLLHPSWIYRVELLKVGALAQYLITQTGVSAGSYTVTFEGVTSVSIPYNDWDALNFALSALPGLNDGGSVIQTTGTPGNGTIQFDLVGAPLDCPPLIINRGTTNGSTVSSIIRGPGLANEIGGRLDLRGTDVLFDSPRQYEEADRLYLHMLIRAYDWCRASSNVSFGQRSGLNTDSAEAVPTIEHVSAAAMIVLWQRRPRLVGREEGGWRALGLADSIQEFQDYQNAYLRGVTYSPLLKYDVNGGPLDLRLPLSMGLAVPGAGLRSLVGTENSSPFTSPGQGQSPAQPAAEPPPAPPSRGR